MTDRRGFLKLFGAGATIAPIVGGVVLREDEARVIEPPKVELVREKPPEEFSGEWLRGEESWKFLRYLNRFDVHVDIYDRETKRHVQMHADAINTKGEGFHLMLHDPRLMQGASTVQLSGVLVDGWKPRR